MMNSKIIGGEYTIDLNSVSARITNNTQACYPSGRAALQAILNRISPERSGAILIPDHICGSVPKTVKNMGFKCEFYHIEDDLRPAPGSFDILPADITAVILVNYFGIIPTFETDQLINDIRSKSADITVIVDDVQNYYGLEAEKKCDYAFTSLRKWFPVPDGAYVIRNTSQSQEHIYPVTDSNEAVAPLFSKYKFAGNVLKNYKDIIGDSICLELIEKGEQLIDNDISDIALPWTNSAMENMDHSAIKAKRQQNAAILHENLIKMGIQHMYIKDATPLFVPVILEKDRDSIRKKMFENSIFCPVHWNDGWQSEFTNVEINPLSHKELSLICDQRYTEEDMYHQLEILKNACIYH